jgi:hypothetical protein
MRLPVGSVRILRQVGANLGLETTTKYARAASRCSRGRAVDDRPDVATGS